MTAALMDWLDNIEDIANETIEHGELYFEWEGTRYKLRKLEGGFEGDFFRLSWRRPDTTVMFEDFFELDQSIKFIRNNRERC